MESRKIEMLLPQNKPLTELVEIVAKSIGPEKIFQNCRLTLPNKTKNKRTVEVYAKCGPTKKNVRRLELRLYGGTVFGKPSPEELEYVKRSFGEKDEVEKYDDVNNGPTLKVIKDEKLDSEASSETDSEGVLIHLHSSRTNREVEFILGDEKDDYGHLWELTLVECAPRFFPKQRMNGINDYFRAYIESHITSIKWDVIVAEHALTSGYNF